MCLCSQQHLVGQPSARLGSETSLLAEGFKGSTHMCVLTAAIGRPTLDPWVQPLIALFCYSHVCARSSNWSCACPQQQLLGQLLTFGCRPQLPYSATHMCVCVLTAAIGLPKLLNVQNPHLTPSLTAAATHVCVLTAAIGRDPQSVYPETHMCMPTAASGRPTLGLVCAHSSNWSAKPHVTYDQNLHLALFCTRDVCAHSSYWSCACPQHQLVGQPLTLGCNHSSIGLPNLLNVQNPQLTSSCNYSVRHICVLTAAIWFAKVVVCSKPSVDSFIDVCCNTHVFSHQQWVGQASIGLV